MRRPKGLPEYDAHEHRMLMAELKDVMGKRENLRTLRLMFTKEYRTMYMRHRMRVHRGVMTPERAAEMDKAHAKYANRSLKWRQAHETLCQKEKELRRRIALYQKASLYI